MTGLLQAVVREPGQLALAGVRRADHLGDEKHGLSTVICLTRYKQKTVLS